MRLTSTSKIDAMDSAGNSTKANCQYLDVDYDPTLSVICGTHLLFGIVYCLFGYRCFKAVMFLTGSIFASVVVYLVCREEDLMSAYGNAGVALGAGFLFGLITMLVHYVGLFVLGLHTGLLLGIIAMTAAQQYIEITNMWICIGVLLGCALFAAILTLGFQKSMTIFGTSVYGGVILAAALDYFVEKFQMVLWMWEHVQLTKHTFEPCWFSWLLLSIWPFMVVVGTTTQACITGKDFYHKYRPRRTPRSRTSQRPVPESASRPRAAPRRYRYVYQVRTAHGDVISQRYIQALRKMVPYTTRNATLQSAYALCPAESDNEGNVGTWSTAGTDRLSDVRPPN